MSYADSIARPRFFGCPKWLGFQHNGYPVVELKDYLRIRRPNEGLEPVQAETTEERAASTQSLLTFGLLEAVIWDHVPENELVVTDNFGTLVLSRKHLIGLMEVWIDRIRRCQSGEAGHWLKRAHENIREAHSLMMGMSKSRFLVFKPLGIDAPSMICLVALIGEALHNAKGVFPSTTGQGFSWNMAWVQENPNDLTNEMVTDGWCPSVAQYLYNTASVSSLEFATACGPARDGKYHGDCSAATCSRYIIDAKTYTPKHLSSCPSSSASPSDKRCTFSAPVFNDVKGLLLDKQVPVITLAEGSDPNSVELKVHRSTELAYVAISHVWADGLGSSTEAGLPACQLRRLADLASKVLPGAAIWLDGICIPEADDLRGEAIGLMARTYRDATAVLVLDGGLQHCRTTEPLGVTILRVLTSGWMRRLWTLQEALLAKELHLVFAGDSLLLLKDVLPRSKDMMLNPHLTDLAKELFRLTKLSSDDDYRIGDVARSLEWRATNRPSDETLAIASLLGLQPAVLVHLNAEERMMQLLRAIGKMPRNVLFLSGFKLRSPGFRWAPTSFMDTHAGSSGGAMLSTRGSDARLTPRGLEATYYAFLFPLTTFQTGQRWSLKVVKSGRLYRVSDLSKGRCSYTCDMLLLNDNLSVGAAGPCVAVLRHNGLMLKGAGGSFTVYCEYQRRLVISEDVERRDAAGDTLLLVNVSGMIDVCVS